jgi:hypothetical protein
MFSLQWIEGGSIRASFLHEWTEIKKPPGRVADFWFCLCGTGTLAGDSDFELWCSWVEWTAAALGCVSLGAWQIFKVWSL